MQDNQNLVKSLDNKNRELQEFLAQLENQKAKLAKMSAKSENLKAKNAQFLAKIGVLEQKCRNLEEKLNFQSEEISKSKQTHYEALQNEETAHLAEQKSLNSKIRAFQLEKAQILEAKSAEIQKNQEISGKNSLLKEKLENLDK